MSAVELELTATITYEPAKGRVTTTDEAVPILRQDLDALGIPHPKRANISVVYPGTVRFFWIALSNSPIHKKLMESIRPRYNTSEHRESLDQLLIRSMDLRETVAASELPYYPRKQDAREWAHPYTRPAPGNANSAQFSGGHGFDSSYGRELNPESLVDRIATPSSSYLERNPTQCPRIKAEPVIETIPPSVHRPYQDQDDEMQVDTSTPSRFTFGEWRKQPAPPVSLDRNRYKSIPDRDFGFNNDHDPNSSNNHEYRHTRNYSNHSYKHDHYDQKHEHDLPEVQDLRRELRDIRRQMTADIAEERKIVESLRELGAEVEAGGDATEVDFVTKARLERFEADLQTERARRRRLEEIVEDVRRERRAPFVVPALLDAFIEISQLTSEVMEG
ncbi:hypothetical protein K438DRAFT_1821866 [Mycena galopus ATCC 62051]|nr:hypothetical protein K438DRAFT_1821866 [Mycena galopus ATCC 62051]